MRGVMLLIWRDIRAPQVEAQAIMQDHQRGMQQSAQDLQNHLMLMSERMEQSKRELEKLYAITLRDSVKNNAESMLDIKIENNYRPFLNNVATRQATGSTSTQDQLDYLNAKMDIMESISRDKSELKKIVSKVIPNLIVSKAIPNLFEIDTLSGLRSSDMKPLEICIDSALQSQNPAEATAEFFTPGMLLGTAVENNHHLGAMFAQFGLDCIGIKRAEEAAKAAAAAEMQVQDQSELSDFLDSADFCTIM